MANSSNKTDTYKDKIDEEYFIDFNNEVLKQYLPPRYKDKRLDELPEGDLEKAIHKWSNEPIINDSQYEYIKNVWAVHRLIIFGVEFITDLQLEKIKIKAIDVSHGNYEIVKNHLVQYYDRQCREFLYFIKNYDSIKSRIDSLFSKGRSVFVSKEANEWFIKMLETKYNIKNGASRGLNAFVNALINNEMVKKHILLKSWTQRNVVEYINLFYEKELIKNHTRLSDASNYIIEVDELIKLYIEAKNR